MDANKGKDDTDGTGGEFSMGCGDSDGARDGERTMAASNDAWS
jgi:hypothetical protein